MQCQRSGRNDHWKGNYRRTRYPRVHLSYLSDDPRYVVPAVPQFPHELPGATPAQPLPRVRETVIPNGHYQQAVLGLCMCIAESRRIVPVMSSKDTQQHPAARLLNPHPSSVDTAPYKCFLQLTRPFWLLENSPGA